MKKSREASMSPTASSNSDKKQRKRRDKNKNKKVPANQCNNNAVIFREIKCSEPLIFHILASSKDFYQKEWKVILSSQAEGPLQRLNSSINGMIKKLIKIYIQYKENEFGNVTKTLDEFKEKYKELENIKIVYTHSQEENLFILGLTALKKGNKSVKSELTLLKKEIIDWNFDIVKPGSEFMAILNYNSNLDALGISNALDVNQSKLNFFIIENVLLLEYKPDKGKLLKTIV